MSDVVIRVENLCKEYRLGTISHGTLYQDLQSSWARLKGKEDPNTKVDLINQAQLNSTNEKFCALKDVSFDIRQGEIVGIIGRNGAGKSTLLKILSQVTAPTSGTVKIKGRVASLLEIGTGFHPELTGRENIFLNGSILGMNKWEIEQKFDEIVKFSEIEKFIDTPVKRYSSGMYVRLAFAVAAHLEPEILIVDEVLAVGDTAFQKKCLGKMGEVAKEGRTILFVSHNLTAISQLCMRVILLNNGNVLADGSTQEILNIYTEVSSVDRNVGSLANPILRSSNSNPNSLIKWTHIKLLNSSGKSVRDVFYHEPFDFVFQGSVVRKCENILIGLAITSKLKGLIFTTHQAYEGVSTTISEGLLEVCVNINPNLLAPGHYEVEIAAEGPGVGDWIPIALEFSVLELGITSAYKWGRPGRNGIIDYPCKWNINYLSTHKTQSSY